MSRARKPLTKDMILAAMAKTKSNRAASRFLNVSYIHYHCRHLQGIDFNKLTKKILRTGNYECWLPTITNKVEAKDSFLVHDWSVAQNISSQPVKITMPGPMTITDTIANDYYTSNRELGEDLAKAINVEIKRLQKAGCKYIQVDEPLFARKPQQAIDFGIDNLAKCFDGLDNTIIEKIYGRYEERKVGVATLHPTIFYNSKGNPVLRYFTHQNYKSDIKKARAICSGFLILRLTNFLLKD